MCVEEEHRTRSIAFSFVYHSVRYIDTVEMKLNVYFIRCRIDKGMRQTIYCNIIIFSSTHISQEDDEILYRNLKLNRG